MFALAAEEGWPLERRREAIIRLHQRDDTLRALVSPSFVEGSEARTGSCRRVTEQLERLSVNIESWEDMEAFNFREVVSDALQIMDDLLVTLSAMGVPDFYRVLDDLHQIGGVGLGEHLRSFIDIGNRLLSGGVEGLMEGASSE
jgi:hypothetical protein